MFPAATQVGDSWPFPAPASWSELSSLSRRGGFPLQIDLLELTLQGNQPLRQPRYSSLLEAGGSLDERGKGRE